MHARLRRALAAWYGAARRDFPWRHTSDPYAILVSEIMLQQTRSQTVVPYFERFLECYPSAGALAAASVDEVLARWSGLGYYSRARHLHAAARRIAALGAFPRDYSGIRALPGVGDYTAAAVASIAFGLPHAAVDGNVLRVVARLTGDASDIGSLPVRRRFAAVARDMLDPQDPGTFNQALMELGATVCVPRVPRCAACPLAGQCRARADGTVSQLPVKLKHTEPLRAEATLAVVRRRGCVLLRQRPAEARRLAGFWELPAPGDLPGARVGRTIGRFRHSITHHRYVITVVEASARAPRGFLWVPAAEIGHLPLSTTTRKALHLAAQR